MTGPLFPENYTRVWVRGRFVTLLGQATRGTLTLQPNVTGGVLLDRAAELIISSAGFSASADPVTGYAAAQVPATNDPDITPVNFTYSVTEPSGRKYTIVVPYDTPVLDDPDDPLHGQQVLELIDVVPVGTAGGTAQLLRGVGIASMVADGDGGILVSYTDGTTTTLPMPGSVVNTDAAPGSTIYVGSVAPLSPAPGDVWISPS